MTDIREDAQPFWRVHRELRERVGLSRAELERVTRRTAPPDGYSEKTIERMESPRYTRPPTLGYLHAVAPILGPEVMDGPWAERGEIRLQFEDDIKAILVGIERIEMKVDGLALPASPATTGGVAELRSLARDALAGLGDAPGEQVEQAAAAVRALRDELERAERSLRDRLPAAGQRRKPRRAM